MRLGSNVIVDGLARFRSVHSLTDLNEVRPCGRRFPLDLTLPSVVSCQQSSSEFESQPRVAFEFRRTFSFAAAVLSQEHRQSRKTHKTNGVVVQGSARLCQYTCKQMVSRKFVVQPG
jgi:hypothetical protein